MPSHTVQIPTGLARAWAASNDVGMNAEQPVAGRSPLVILIEKDFACLEPRGDEDKDAFPHPGSPSGTC